MAEFELQLYNTASRRVEALELDSREEVRIYSCGPTVYRSVHLGNLRSYLLADCLKRLLLRRGFRVRHVKNITDVGHMRQELLDRGEDKVIAEALAAGLTPRDIARRYTDEFFHDEQCMNILAADVFPRATDHVERTIAITAELLANGHAYERSGNVYFRVSSFDGYGERAELCREKGCGKACAPKPTRSSRIRETSRSGKLPNPAGPSWCGKPHGAADSPVGTSSVRR